MAQELTAEQKIAHVQGTWKAAGALGAKVPEIFYAKLFEVDPSAAKLFEKTDLSTQGQRLIDMLTLAVNSLNDLDALVPKLQALGKRHIKYGVEEKHYPSVACALLYTLETGLGDAYTADVKASWVWVWGIVSTTMIDAAYKK